jgi:hypothetical protein
MAYKNHGEVKIFNQFREITVGLLKSFMPKFL